MSSISPVADRIGLSPLVQRLTATAPATLKSTLKAAAAATATHHKGKHSAQRERAEAASALRGKIESAVATALKDYQGYEDEVHATVQNAIRSALTGSGDLTATTTGDASKSSGSNSPTSIHAKFEALLQAHDIDASSFRNDIRTAFAHPRAVSRTSPPPSATEDESDDADAAASGTSATGATTKDKGTLLDTSA